MPRGKSDRNPQRESEANLGQRTPQHKNKYVTPLRTQGHAHTNLAGPARHRVRCDSIQPNRRQQQSQDPKQKRQARDQTFLIEVAAHLVVERMQVGHRQVGINVCQGAPHHRVKVLRRTREPQSHRVDKERPAFRHDHVGGGESRQLLSQRPEIHRTNFVPGARVLGVRDNAHNFKGPGVLGVKDAKVLSDGILFREESLDESFIDHRHQLGSCGIGIGNAAPAQHGLPHGFEKAWTHPVPGGARIGSCRRASGKFDALAPVVAFQCAIQRQANALYAGKSRKRLLQPLIESGQPGDRVTGARRVQMQHIPVRRLNAKVLMLQVPQRLRQQPRTHQQHQRQRCLKNNQGFLRQRSTIARRPVHTPQRFRRIGVRADPRRHDAEHHPRQQRQQKRKP